MWELGPVARRITIQQDQEVVWSVPLVRLAHHPLLDLYLAHAYLVTLHQDLEAVWSVLRYVQSEATAW
jgi:hypothetical protein